MFEPAVPPAKPKGECPATPDRLIAVFGSTRLVDNLAAEDFEALREALAKRYGPVRLGNEIQKVRTVFKDAYDSGLTEKSIRYGPQFKRPSASVMRQHRAQAGERMLEADELRRLLEAAPVPLKVMLLLGINAGFGNHEVATLPVSAFDLDRGWLRQLRLPNGKSVRGMIWTDVGEA
jgi:hypothetical protein